MITWAVTGPTHGARHPGAQQPGHLSLYRRTAIGLPSSGNDVSVQAIRPSARALRLRDDHQGYTPGRVGKWLRPGLIIPSAVDPGKPSRPGPNGQGHSSGYPRTVGDGRSPGFRATMHPPGSGRVLMAGAFGGQRRPQPGQRPQVADRFRRHERGPQHAPLVQFAQPDAVQLVRLRPAGHVLHIPGVDQPHLQPGGLQQVETPVGRRRGICGAGPFPATPGPNRTGTFRCIRLSSNVYVQAAAGFPPWMTWWQGAQTMSVLRLIFAIRAARAGGCCPGEVRSASLRTWWVSTVARWPHHSHPPLRGI